MQLVDRLDMNRVGEMDPTTLRSEIRGVVENLCDTENPLLNRNERQRLVGEILDETFGFGPLELLLKDEKIADIMINGPKMIFVEKEGRIQRSEVTFRDNEHLLQIIDRIVSRVGRRVDETSPMVDARLPNGSRFNAIIPPLALDGAVVTIRMFGSRPINKDDLLRFKAFTPEMLALMEGAMKSRLNVIISGGTGSGKTTLLNTLSGFIQPDHRVITIEDAAELQLQQDHVVRLETRPPNIEGRGAVGATDLVKNALRMRPDRIIIGECRGAETLDMIQAMNTGHEGSMTTVHANTPRDALSRLETMISMAGLELPIRALRSQFASAVDLIIQASRLQGGPRKVTSISEVIGMEGDTIIMQEIFNSASRHRRQRPGLRRVPRHGRPPLLHGPPGAERLPPQSRYVPPACPPQGLGPPTHQGSPNVNDPMIISMLVGATVLALMVGVGLAMSRSANSLAEQRL
ncbi:MAG: CpaF family protein, partial [Singulisphaera sp.]